MKDEVLIEAVDEVLCLTGLAGTATKKQVEEWFTKDGIVVRDVQMCIREQKKRMGKAYVFPDSKDDLEKGLLKDKQLMGSRYMRVSKVARSSVNVAPEDAKGCLVRINDLSEEATEDDIIRFFVGLEIVPGSVAIYPGVKAMAFVQFLNSEAAQKALKRHKGKLAGKFVRIYLSNMKEKNRADVSLKDESRVWKAKMQKKRKLDEMEDDDAEMEDAEEDAEMEEDENTSPAKKRRMEDIERTIKNVKQKRSGRPMRKPRRIIRARSKKRY